MDEKELQALYNAMSKQFDIGDWNTFKGKMQTTNDRKRFYDVISKEGFDLGDYSTYESRLAGVKKKETLGSVGLQIGGKVGAFKAPSLSAGSLSVGEVEYEPETQRIEELMKGVKHSPQTQADIDRITIQEGDDFDANDPLKSINRRLLEKTVRFEAPKAESTKQQSLSADNKIQKQASEAKIERITPHNAAEAFKAVTENTFPSSKEARQWLYQSGKKFDENNETDVLARNVINNYENVKSIIGNNNGDLTRAAIDYYSEKDPELKYLKSKGQLPPESTQSDLLYNFLQDKNVKELANTNAEFHNIYREQADNYWQNHPEQRTNKILSQIAQGREDLGYNNPFINLVGANSSDRVIQELELQGKIDPFDVDYYKKVVRPIIQLHAKTIPTSGLLETAFQSATKAVEDVPKGVYEATGLRDLVTTQAERTYKSMEEDAGQIGFRPKGINKISHATGNLAGVLFPIGGEAKILTGLNIMKDANKANQLMMGLTFYHDLQKEAERNNPGDPLGNHLTALIQSAIFMKINKVFPTLSKTITGEAKAAINDVLGKLKNNEISGIAAKEAIVNTVVNKAKEIGGKTITGSSEMALATGLNDVVAGVFNGKFDADKTLNNMAHTFESMALGMPLLNLATLRGSQRAITGDMLMEISERPDYFREQIKKGAELDPEFAKYSEMLLKNLGHTVEIRKALDGMPELNNTQKRDFMIAEMQQKVLEKKIEDSPSKTLNAKDEKQLEVIEIEKKKILDPEMSNTKLVQEFYDNELLGKGSMEQLEVDGKFSESKVGEYLKFIAQQANNLDENWKPHEGKAPSMSEVPEAIIEAANKRWEKEIDNAKSKQDAIQKQITDEMDVRQQTGDGEGVVEGNAKPEITTGEKEGEIKGEEKTVTTPQQGTGSPAVGSGVGDVEITSNSTHTGIINGKEATISVGHVITDGNYKGNANVNVTFKDGSGGFGGNMTVVDIQKAVKSLPTQEVKAEQPTPTEQPSTPQPTATTEGEGVRPTEPPAAEPPPTEPPPPKEPAMGGEGGAEGVGITHAETDKIARELGFPEYEGKPETFAEWDAEADRRIAEGYNIEKLLKRLEDGEMPDKIEQRILAKYVASLKAKIDVDPSNENLAKAKRAIDLANVLGGREVAKSLVARKGLQPLDETLADRLLTEMEDANVNELTEQQKATVKEEFEKEKAVKDALQKKIEELQEENARLKAGEVVSEERKRAKRGRKTDSDFTNERKSIIEDIKDKLKKARSETNVVGVPYAKELFAIAPDVAKLVKSLVEQGVVKLEDVITNVYDVLKDEIKDLTKKDVQDIIAGEYSQNKQTRNELSATLRDLRDEAALLNRIEELEKGEVPKDEKKKIERNRRIKELKDKIKQSDVTQLAEAKKKIQSQITKIEKQLQEGDFETKKPKEIQLDREGKELKKKLIQLRKEREVRRLKLQYDKRNKFERGVDKVLEAFNIPRSLMASTDFSAPLNQAIVATIAYPKLAKAASAEMMKSAFSQQNFDNWFYELKDDPRYDMMKDLKLGIADPHSPFLTAREEAFMSGYAEQIPGIGRLVKGSERAYVQYLNKMRVDLFNRFTDRFEEKGKPYNEKNKRLYEKMAKYINNITGRGNMGKLEQFAPVFNTLFFSPRLMAARINMLNPYYFATLPKELKIQYGKDMGKFLALGSTVLSLFALYGKTQDDDDEDKITVENDVRSSDFGKIKQGDTRWNIWGGFQPYVRLAGQIASGERKSTTTGLEQKLDGKGAFGTDRGDVISSFFRGKLSPIFAMGIDFTSGRTAAGEPVTLEKELWSHVIPLSTQSVIEGWKQYGPTALANIGLPSIFGIGTQTYGRREKEIKDIIEKGGKEVKLTKEQHEYFKKVGKEKIDKYVEKLQKLPEYKEMDKEQQLSVERVVKNKAMKDAEKLVIDKFRLKFEKTREEKAAEKKEDKTVERIKKAVLKD